MTIQIQVRMPNAAEMTRRAAAVRAIEAKTDKSFSVLFIETNALYNNDTYVECHNKGVGQRTLEKWTTAVRVALKSI